MKLLLGDCLDKLKELDDNSIDSIVTDPPYGLSFMGKKWDYDVPSQAIWEECIRVLKPGGHLLSFAGSRTYHRMAVRIEDAGFEIRDQIMWVYGSGFPKSHNLIKQIEKENICQFTKNVKTNNVITQLKHIQVELNEGMIDSVLTNVVMYQEEGLENKTVIGVVVDSSPMDMSIFVTKEDIEENTTLLLNNLLEENLKKGKKFITLTELRQIIDLKIFNLLPNQSTLKSIETLHGTALKPSHEPIVMARKPLSENTVAQNVLEWGTGGINIDGCRISTDETITNHSRSAESAVSKGKYGDSSEQETHQTEGQLLGRFPANIIFDEEAGKILDEQSGISKSSGGSGDKSMGALGKNGKYGNYALDVKAANSGGLGDVGGASRFFYCPKTSKRDRNEGLDSFIGKSVGTLNDNSSDLENYGGNSLGGASLKGEHKAPQPKQNFHPTVKPTDLMAYLIRLVTPKGGIVLDPFMGSGSTGKAAVREGMDFVGIEREKEYYDIAEARIQHEIDNPYKAETKTRTEVKEEVKKTADKFFSF
jgi:DNA modification methylase